jgi:hypothetical protein
MNLLLATAQPGVLYYLLFVLAALAFGTLMISFLSRLFYREKQYLELPLPKRLVIASLTLVISGSLSAAGVFYLSTLLSASQTW